jgi:type II secretory pathway pseudopilin PulG
MLNIQLHRIGQDGMSTTELMISIGIATVLTLFLGSELQGMVNRVDLQAAASDVVADLQHARTLAVWERRGVQVMLDARQPALSIFRSGNSEQPVQPSRNLMRRGIRHLDSTGGLTLNFSPRGTSATPTTITLEGRNGERRVITVSLTGIVRAR